VADKNLKISVKSDLRDGQKLTRFVQDLHQKVEKFAKVLGNLRLGGGAPGPTGKPAPGEQTLAKQLEGDKKAMENLGREVDNLSRRFQNLGRAAQGSGFARAPFMRPGGSGLTSGPPWLQPPGGGPGGPGGPPGGPGGGPPGGGGPSWWQRMNQPVGGTMGQIGRFVGWGAVVRNLFEGVMGGPQRQIDWAMNQGRAGAESAQSMGGLGARMLGGDIGPSLGLMRAMGGGHGGAKGFNRGDFESIVDAAPGQALNAAIRAGITSAVTLNLVKGWNDAGRAATPAARAARMNELVSSVIETGQQQNPMDDARIAYARGQAPGRVGFSRRFGSNFAAGVPLGNTVDPTQVMATVSAVLDVLGTSANATKVTKMVTEATRLGLSNEAIQTMLRAQEVGGGNLLNRVLRSGLSRPMMERAGTGAAGMVSSSLLRLNANNFVGGFTAGGADTDELTMRRLEAGAGFLNQVTTGGLDQYQATVNMALATKKGRSVFTTGVMGKMSLNELMQAARNPTPEQLAMGITQPAAAELLNAEVNSLGARYFSERGVDQPAGLRRLQEALGGEGGLMGAATRFRDMGKAGEDALTELQAGLNMVTGAAAGTDSLSFLTGAQAPSAIRPKATETRGAHGTALESTMAGAKEMERDWIKMDGAMKDVRATLSTFTDTVREFGFAMQQNTPEGVKISAESLMGLGSAMGEISKKGPEAVKVMDAVERFVNALAAKRAAIEEAAREQDFMGVGP
jgi:hypothetical protein